jgi:hypothetical protein
MSDSACRGRRAGIGLFSLVLLSLGGPLAASSWRSELYADDWVPPQAREGLDFRTDEFVQDYSYAGYHRGERAIPTVKGPVFDVLDYGADASGTSDSTDAMQAAIDAAVRAGGGVVWMPEGTYLLSRPSTRNHALRIAGSGVVLRGAGPEKTFLVNTTTSMRSARVLLAAPASGANWATARGGVALLARDYPGPTQELELASWQGYEVGDWIVVHNPFTDAVSAEGSFVEEVKMDGSVAASPSWVGRGGSLRGPMNYRQITAVDPEARTLRLDAPTRWSLLRRDGARVYYADPLLEEVGLEGFSIGNRRHPASTYLGENDYSNSGRPAYEMHDSWLVAMERIRHGWVRDVRSFNPGNDNGVHMLSGGLVLDWSRGITVERVEMQRTQYGGGGGNGYMIRLNSVNEVLVRFSRVAYARHGILIWRMQNSGNVVHRNLDEFTGVQTGHTGTLQNTSGRGSDHHGLLSHSNLFDRHVLNQSFVEAAFRGTSGGNPPHGQSASQSLYWNTEGKSYYTGRSYIVHSQQAGRGYVIGTQGVASGVNTGPRASGSEGFTTPLDRVEGVGLGAELEPASLYEDQLRRRFAREGLTPPTPASRPAVSLVWGGDPETLRLRLRPDFGRTYRLEASSTLGPASWVPGPSTPVGEGGIVEWSDLPVPEELPAYFRVVSAP